jgi:hypothetical protein
MPPTKMLSHPLKFLQFLIVIIIIFLLICLKQGIDHNDEIRHYWKGGT